MGISTTITTHINDLEYGTCEWDADRSRLLALDGVGAGAAKPGVCVGDHDGKCRESIVRTTPKVRERLEGDGVHKSEDDATVVGTLVRTLLWQVRSRAKGLSLLLRFVRGGALNRWKAPD
ncbi:hypothetical protein BDW60DRAFT_57392 [Aspergillus nidulans var. acristatus]